MPRDEMGGWQMKKYLIGAIAVAAIAMGGAAHATTYLLNYDACSGGCGLASYGQINVTGQGTGLLTVDIELNANTVFQQAGSNPHDEIWFDTNTTSATLAGFAAPFSTNGAQATGSHQANGASLGTYDYTIQRAHAGNPGSALSGQHSLTFTVAGPSSLALDYTTVGDKNLYFIVDVAAFNPATGALVNTGRVGATLAPTVPEPASWALMILGFGGVGAVLRRRRTLVAA
jgi:hypothetical protein